MSGTIADDDIVVVNDERVGTAAAPIGVNNGPYDPPITFVPLDENNPAEGTQMTARVARDSGYIEEQ